MTTHQSHLSDLLDFLRIPSVSSLPEHKQDMDHAVEFLEEKLRAAGFLDVGKYWAKGQEDRPALLFGQRITNKNAPTILIYGHYDVQPPDPLEDWISPPFEPDMRDGNIYARGATDDKGQVYTHIAALLDFQKQYRDSWPVNIKIMLEGEEEMGGDNIHEWLLEPQAQKMAAADVCVLSDTQFVDNGVPAIEYGLRGLVYFQIDIKLAEHDLHSGQFGGGVMNPANALTYIFSKLYDAETGKILIPHLYDNVATIDTEEQELLNLAHPADDVWRSMAGNAYASFGDINYPTSLQLTVRPSLDINGIWGGFSGEGQKTIIPAEAHAKFSVRFVPNQTPEEIEALVLSYVREIAPASVQVTVSCLARGDGAVIDRHSPWMKAASQSLLTVFGKEPLFSRAGGSIPVVADIKRYLGIDSIMMGYGLPDDNLHAPNEKFSIEQFEKGIECNKRFYELCGGLERSEEVV